MATRASLQRSMDCGDMERNALSCRMFFLHMFGFFTSVCILLRTCLRNFMSADFVSNSAATAPKPPDYPLGYPMD